LAGRFRVRILGAIIRLLFGAICNPG